MTESSIGGADFRELFDIPKEVVYLNCANMAPQLRSITKSGIAAVCAKAAPWRLKAPDWFSGAEELRELAARLLGTEADAVALVPGASYGIAVAAANLPLAAGQSIVLLDQEFPSNVYAWQLLAQRKSGHVVTVHRARTADWTEALEQSIDARTAIVAVPQCHWTDGSRVDLERIGDRARAVGAALVIDASQSLGACPLNLGRVQPDFLVAVGYKWLLGPYGLGYLYVAPKWRGGTPLEQSWLTRAGSENFARLVDYSAEYRPGARRFDMGEYPQFVLAPMAITALQHVLAWGVVRIAQLLAPLTAAVAGLAGEHGFTILPAAQRCAHMIGLRRPSGIQPGLAARLTAGNIHVSVRGDCIRVAPHLYNGFSDIDRLFAALHAANDSSGHARSG